LPQVADLRLGLRVPRSMPSTGSESETAMVEAVGRLRPRWMAGAPMAHFRLAPLGLARRL